MMSLALSRVRDDADRRRCHRCDRRYGFHGHWLVTFSTARYIFITGIATFHARASVVLRRHNNWVQLHVVSEQAEYAILGSHKSFRKLYLFVHFAL